MWGMGIMLSAGKGLNPSRPVYREVPIALDNGAFSAWKSGRHFSEFRFLQALMQIEERGINLDFIVCPDIVASEKSLSFSILWRNRLPTHRLYLAVQDGMESKSVELYFHMFQGIFVGGTMDWKIKTSPHWRELSRKHNLPLHIARIGTIERLRWAKELGADSVDSTNFVRNNSFDVIKEFTNPRQGVLI